mgnify:CR=1 FL=1
MSMVRYKQGKLPPITDKRKLELKLLANMPDNEIDYSDIPPLDTDVLVWLKSQGKGYQTRMNAILREAMLRSLQRKL